jgi:hypothetical protein
MSFPTSPTNGQISVVNNVAYQYATANSSWTRVLSIANVIQANVVSANILSVVQAYSVTGNITTGNYFIGNGAFLTGIAAGSSYSNANVAAYLPTYTGNLVSLTGPVTTTSNVTANNVLFGTGVVSGTGTVYAATVSTTGNVNSGYISTGQASVGNLISGGYVSATGNITSGNILTSGLISATGNITGGNILGGANVNATTHTGTTVSVTANVTGGNLLTAGQISATGTITSNGATNGTAFAVGNSAVSNVALGMFPTAGQAGEYAIRDYSNVFTNMYLDVGMGGTANGAFQFRTSNSFRLLANVNSSGISTPFAVSATGNVTGNYFIGNGSQLTGISSGSSSNITNGTSNVVVAASGNVTVAVAGTAAVATFYTAGITANSIAATNNGGGYNFKVGDDAWIGDINTADTIGIRGQQNNANGYIVFGNTDASTKLGRAGSGPLTYDAAFSAVGNITGGNLLTGGLISAAGTITTGGNISLIGNIVDTGALWINTTANGNITLNANGTGVITFNNPITNGQANGVGNIGNSTGYFNTVFAKATSAQYADLAEMYVADADYPPGTVLEFGGNHEVTISNTAASPLVAGVVSTNPAHLMNSTAQGEHVVAIALVGRVPTFVIGPVFKGAMMVSAGNGHAQASAKPAMGTVIGKAVEDFAGKSGIIEIAVGRL